MKKLQERKLSMYEVVHAFLTGTDATIISQMPLMSDAIADLGGKIDSISGFGNTQKISKEGVSDVKIFLRNQLTLEILDVSKKVSAYATNTANRVLLKEVKFSKSAVEKLPENMLVIVGNIVFTKAKDNLADLATYGVTDQVVDDLRAMIDAYDDSIPKPRTSIVVKKIATGNLKTFFAETDALLKDKMDVLAGVIQFSEPDFYANYINSRIIVDTGSHHLAVRGKVVDVDGMPIAGVTASVVGLTVHYLTKAKGSFYVKSLPAGTYLFTFSKEGYMSNTVSVVVASDARTDVDVTLSLSGTMSKAS